MRRDDGTDQFCFVEFEDYTKPARHSKNGFGFFIGKDGMVYEFISHFHYDGTLSYLIQRKDLDWMETQSAHEIKTIEEAYGKK